MQFTRNFADGLQIPSFILTKASGERIGVIPCVKKEYTKHFDSPDEISFTSYLYQNDELNPYYERLENMQYIEVPDIGRFIIQSVTEQNEGTRLAYKEITCKDISVLFAQRYLELFYINEGTVASLDGVKFYDMADTEHSLLHLIISELFPSWQIDHIDAELQSKQRSFEVQKQDVYSFLMDSVAPAFECHFVFDTTYYKINAYTNENIGQDSNISVSFNNLLKSTNISADTDNIKTCMVLTGQDEITIREIARGSDRIYNFNYYCSPTFWTESLYNAYNSWQNLTYHTPVDWLFLKNDLKDSDGNLYFVFDNEKDLDGNYILNFMDTQQKYRDFITAQGLEDNYNNLYTFLLARYQNYYTNVAEWTSQRIPAGNNARYFGYGMYPMGYPDNVDPESEETFQIERYKTVEEVSTLPSEGDPTVLYLLNNSSYGMYRWYDGSWLNTNNWSNIALNPLNEKLKSAENSQAVAMKNGYGSRTVDTKDSPTDKEKERQEKNYISYYLPYYYSVCKLNDYIATCQGYIDSYKSAQDRIGNAMSGISYLTDMKNNLTVTQLAELSRFIREDSLDSSNYVVTDIMSDEERFEMLNQLLEYGENELEKVAQPQFSFSVNMANIFAIPEFDKYSGYFDVGNYIHVTFRDDYSVKATLTELHIDFYNPDSFSVTFGNTLRKSSKGVLTDIADMAKEAHSMASSVSFNASYWTLQAQNADVISQQLSEGLLEAGNFLRSGIHSEFLVDERGVFVTTVSDDPSDPNYEHAKTSDTDTDYDSIYIGGGRMLFTDDGWQTVKMSVGRGEVSLPVMQDGELKFIEESKFGVFADFLVAGYVGGSTIVGGDIFSSNYKTSTSVTSGNAGAHIDLKNGTFEFNNTGKKRLVLDSDGVLRAYGEIYASAGHIGCDDNGDGGFVITSNKLYNGKSSFSSGSSGVYIGTDGISLGTGNTFSVNNSGYLTAVSGTIGGATISSNNIHAGNGRWYINSDGSSSFQRITISDWARISGVQTGSSFGQMGYADGGNWYSSSLEDPFQDGCVTHIQHLAVDSIKANFGEFHELIADYIQVANITANNLKVKAANITGTLTANQINTNGLKIGATNITGAKEVNVVYGASTELAGKLYLKKITVLAAED